MKKGMLIFVSLIFVCFNLFVVSAVESVSNVLTPGSTALVGDLRFSLGEGGSQSVNIIQGNVLPNTEGDYVIVGNSIEIHGNSVTTILPKDSSQIILFSGQDIDKNKIESSDGTSFVSFDANHNPVYSPDMSGFGKGKINFYDNLDAKLRANEINNGVANPAVDNSRLSDFGDSDFNFHASVGKFKIYYKIDFDFKVSITVDDATRRELNTGIEEKRYFDPFKSSERSDNFEKSPDFVNTLFGSQLGSVEIFLSGIKAPVSTQLGIKLALPSIIPKEGTPEKPSNVPKEVREEIVSFVDFAKRAIDEIGARKLEGTKIIIRKYLDSNGKSVASIKFVSEGHDVKVGDKISFDLTHDKIQVANTLVDFFMKGSPNPDIKTDSTGTSFPIRIADVDLGSGRVTGSVRNIIKNAQSKGVLAKSPASVQSTGEVKPGDGKVSIVKTSSLPANVVSNPIKNVIPGQSLKGAGDTRAVGNFPVSTALGDPGISYGNWQQAISQHPLALSKGLSDVKTFSPKIDPLKDPIAEEQQQALQSIDYSALASPTPSWFGNPPPSKPILQDNYPWLLPTTPRPPLYDPNYMKPPAFHMTPFNPDFKPYQSRSPLFDLNIPDNFHGGGGGGSSGGSKPGENSYKPYDSFIDPFDSNNPRDYDSNTKKYDSDEKYYNSPDYEKYFSDMGIAYEAKYRADANGAPVMYYNIYSGGFEFEFPNNGLDTGGGGSTDTGGDGGDGGGE